MTQQRRFPINWLLICCGLYLQKNRKRLSLHLWPDSPSKLVLIGLDLLCSKGFVLVSSQYRSWSNDKTKPHWRSSMKQLVFLFAAVATVAFMSSEANAQRLFGRIFRAQPAVTYGYQPSVTYGYQPTVRSYSPNVARSYSSAPVSNRMPQPVTGYGSNLHRNYMIRRAQKQWAQTGVQPRNTANILWSR